MHAQRDETPTSPDPHDGRPTCDICGDDDLNKQHEWCLLTRSLVCEGCCASIAGFHPGPVLAIHARSGEVVTPEEIALACAECTHRMHELHEHEDPTAVDEFPA